MNVRELQQWLNAHGADPILKIDGDGGKETRRAFLQVFVNKNAKAITSEQLLDIAKRLGDTSTKRINAVAKVESTGGGWFDTGLPKILYERHYFYNLTKGKYGINQRLSNPKSGNYTLDANKNDINDSWEKLSEACCLDPDAALQSVSIGKFQVMGKHYKSLGFDHPIDMLWAARSSEYEHYKMLAGYIEFNNLKKAFLALSTNSETNRALAKGYNGPAYEKYQYHIQLANAMR